MKFPCCDGPLLGGHVNFQGEASKDLLFFFANQKGQEISDATEGKYPIPLNKKSPEQNYHRMTCFPTVLCLGELRAHPWAAKIVFGGARWSTSRMESWFSWVVAGRIDTRNLWLEKLHGFKTGMLDHFYSEQKLEDAIFYFLLGSKTFQPLVWHKKKSGLVCNW